MALTLGKPVLEKIEALQNIMLASMTGGARDDAEYRQTREELFRVPGLKEALPRFVRTCGDLSQLWHFIKTQENLGSYASRRDSRLRFLRFARTKKAPVRDRGVPHSLLGGVCVNQAVVVRNFLPAICSSAQSQSSTSLPCSRPRASYSSYARWRIWCSSSCGLLVTVAGCFFVRSMLMA